MFNANIIVSTVKRDVNYIDRCIDSVRQSYDGIIHLVAGGKDLDYLEKYTHDLKYIIHIIYREEEKLDDTVQKAAYGYYKCLTLDKEKPALILEDDSVLVQNWQEKLLHLLKFTKEEKYVLSLITPWSGSVPVPDIDVPSLQPFQYNAHLTYGELGEIPNASIITWTNTSGVYYPASILKTDLPKFINTFAVHGNTVYDLAAGYFLFRMNVPIYIAVPNLLLPVDTSHSAMGIPEKRVHENYERWDWGKHANW